MDVLSNAFSLDLLGLCFSGCCVIVKLRAIFIVRYKDNPFKINGLSRILIFEIDW